MANSATPAWSMTGYGHGHSPLAGGHVDVQIRTVNHRHADLRIKACPELAEHVPWLEERLRPRLGRGRAEVTLRFEGSQSNAVRIDMDRARGVYAQLVSLRDELDPGQAVPLSLLSQVPGLFAQSAGLPEDAARLALDAACGLALDSLNQMRRDEGAALVRDLLMRLDTIESVTRWIEQRRPALVDTTRERLHARLSKLLEGSSVTPDEGRIEHEIALFADRSDIAEEITRLRSHLAQFRELVNSGGEPVGRKLDFLLQEMGREINTTGSKANDASIAQRVVDLKAELERIREQVQNVL